jgi:hypothetical protein
MSISPDFMAKPKKQQKVAGDGETPVEQTLAIYYGAIHAEEFEEIQKEELKFDLKITDYGRRLIRVARPLVKKNPGLLLSN